MKREAFRITGMSCSACSARVEQCVRKLPGIRKAEVNLLTGSMTVTYDETCQQAENIISAVTAAGYGAEVQKKGTLPGTGRECRLLKRRFLLSLLFLLPLVILHHTLHGPASDLLQAFLLIPIVWLNRSFFISGARAMRQGAPNMDTLVALGATAGILYSTAELCRSGSGVLYLESAGMILTLITFGKWMEGRATGQTGNALEKLRELLPTQAVLLRGEQTVIVPADSIEPGDILLVKAGERIPVDGTVEQGVSSIDESAFTGESLPVTKTAGAEVFAGTLNGQGVLRIRATRSCEHSSLADVITMVGETAAAKAPIARTADTVSGIFVPLSILTAVITAGIWLLCGGSLSTALGCAIAVLVISCPCALGLATPVAIMVGAGKGAERGIIFRSGSVMENARRTDVVILDKTGTITTGQAVVTDVLPRGNRREELLCTAAALEKDSHHPLAAAVCRYTAGLSVSPAQECTYLPGLGIRGLVDGEFCAAGNIRLMQQLGIALTPNEELAAEGKTILYIAREKTFLGIIAVADKLKPDSADAVRALQEKGLRVIMMTGDHALTAKAIAQRVGIHEFQAEALPADKAAKVRQLQQEGLRVAMVGDGINDAPALTAADVGIAIGAGTDVAQESADIILLRNSLTDVAATLQLSRAVIRNIRQNLFWAFLYNALTIPLAAGLYYPLLGQTLTPGIAAAAMSLSSFCVVCNALRLRRLKLPSPSSTTVEPATMTTTITVTGMMCPHCERHMKEAFLTLPEVTGCTASHRENSVCIESSAPICEETLRSTVEQAGYQYGGKK